MGLTWVKSVQTMIAAPQFHDDRHYRHYNGIRAHEQRYALNHKYPRQLLTCPEKFSMHWWHPPKMSNNPIHVTQAVARTDWVTEAQVMAPSAFSKLWEIERQINYSNLNQLSTKCHAQCSQHAELSFEEETCRSVMLPPPLRISLSNTSPLSQWKRSSY